MNTRTNQTQNNKQTLQSEDAKAFKTSSKRTDNEETRTKAKSVVNDQTNRKESTKQHQFNNSVSDKKQPHNNKKTLQESDLRLMIQGISPDTKVILSSLTLRLVSDESKSKVVKVNAQLKSICEHENIELVDNSNITKRGLGVKGLHLNMSRTARLALNFKSVLTKV